MTAPLTPPDCDLRDFPYMQLEVRRLLTSETWVLGTAEEKVAALQLWCEAWHQTPAGSVPDNERMLAHLSGAGANWPAVREQAMRGWVKCTDGRLYHPVVAGKAREAWIKKLAQRERTAAARAARLSQKAAASVTDKGKLLSQTAAPSVTDTVTEVVTGNVTEVVTGSKREGEREGEGEGEGDSKRKKETPLPPSPSGNGGEDASQSDLKAGGRPADWAGQHRGLRATKTNPRAQAEALVAVLAAAPEPDSPLWAKLRAMAMPLSDFRLWIAPLVQAEDEDERAVFIAPTAFHASHVRAQFGAPLARAVGRPVELRAAPPAPRAPPPAASPEPVKPPRKRSAPAPIGQLMPQEPGAGISIANGNSHAIGPDPHGNSHAIGPESGGNGHHVGPDGNA